MSRNKRDKSYSYPPRQELEDSEKYAQLVREMDKLRAAEKRTLDCYEHLKNREQVEEDRHYYELKVVSTNTGTEQPQQISIKQIHTETLESVILQQNLPQGSSEAGTMAATPQKMEPTSCTSEQEDVHLGRVEYTPEEMRYNDLMMHMEGEALEHVRREAINAHSAALQERATLHDSIRQLDEKLEIVTRSLRTAHQRTTTLIALERTAEEILHEEEKMQAIRTALKQKKICLEEEKHTGMREIVELEMFAVEQDRDEENPQNIMDVTTQTFVLKQLGEMEQDFTDIPHPSTGHPEMIHVPPNHQVKRQLSPLSRHSLRDPRSGVANNIDQNNLNLFLATEKIKVKIELASRLNSYLNVLGAMIGANHPRQGVRAVLKKMNKFIPRLQTYGNGEVPEHTRKTNEEDESGMTDEEEKYDDTLPTLKVEETANHTEEMAQDMVQDTLPEIHVQDMVLVEETTDSSSVIFAQHNITTAELTAGESVQDMLQTNKIQDTVTDEDNVEDAVNVEESIQDTVVNQQENCVSNNIIPVNPIQESVVCDPTLHESTVPRSDELTLPAEEETTPGAYSLQDSNTMGENMVPQENITTNIVQDTALLPVPGGETVEHVQDPVQAAENDPDGIHPILQHEKAGQDAVHVLEDVQDIIQADREIKDSVPVDNTVHVTSDQDEDAIQDTNTSFNPLGGDIVASKENTEKETLDTSLERGATVTTSDTPHEAKDVQNVDQGKDNVLLTDKDGNETTVMVIEKDDETSENSTHSDIQEEEGALQDTVADKELSLTEENITEDIVVQKAVAKEEAVEDSVKVNDDVGRETLLEKGTLLDTITREKVVQDTLPKEDAVQKTVAAKEVAQDKVQETTKEVIQDTLLNEDETHDTMIVKDVVQDTLPKEDAVQDTVKTEDVDKDILPDKDAVQDTVTEELVQDTLAAEGTVQDTVRVEEGVQDTAIVESVVENTVAAEEVVEEDIVNADEMKDIADTAFSDTTTEENIQTVQESVPDKEVAKDSDSR